MKAFLYEPNKLVYFHCPGCDSLHAFDPARWEFFNGDMEKPTVRNSILCTWDEQGTKKCHSYITDGFIKFETDSTHHLSGQTVELPDLNDQNFQILS